jgi:PAS domain-containing protein
VSFCGHTILPPTPQILIIEDALDDVRFAGNPLVCGPPRIRFYAGAPLMSSVSGHRYGSLCVIDTKPRRDLTPAHYNLLAQFAELAVREIERDKLTILQQMVAKQRAELSNMSSGVSTTISMRSDGSEAAGDDSGAIQGLTRAADCFVEGVLLVDVSQEPWPVRYANTAFTTTLGVPRDEAISQGFWELFGNRGDGCGKLSMQQIRDAIAAGEPFSVAVSLQSIYTQTPKTVWFDFRPASTTQLHASAPGVPSFVQAQQGGAPSFGATPAEAEENGNASGGLITMYFAIADPKRRFSDLHMEPETTADAADAMMRRQNTAEARTVSEATARAMFGAATLPALPGVPNLQKSAPSAFEDVRLGPLIGRGAYGRVYRATWNGNTVAVKVMETTDAISEIRISVDDDGGLKDGDSWKPHPAGTQGLFEALLSSSLSHPNIVHTYQYAVRPLAQAGTSSSGSSQANGLVEMKSLPRARAPNEVWIISEFCNRGPLLTAIERGAFLTQPSAQYGQPNLIAVLQTLQEVAAAMQYLHSHHIIHGDLTGGNVLLTSSDKDARGFTAKVVDFGLSRFCAREGGVKTKTMGCAEYM